MIAVPAAAHLKQVFGSDYLQEGSLYIYIYIYIMNYEL